MNQHMGDVSFFQNISDWMNPMGPVMYGADAAANSMKSYFSNSPGSSVNPSDPNGGIDFGTQTGWVDSTPTSSGGGPYTVVPSGNNPYSTTGAAAAGNAPYNQSSQTPAWLPLAAAFAILYFLQKE